MITAGIDLGSSSVKAVILSGNDILSWNIVRAGVDKTLSSNHALEGALCKADLTFDNISYMVSTGYGRTIVPSADKQITEITCHAIGANWLYPAARTILDMGGQDCKAIRCDEYGKVIDFSMNDKCAAGTGRFFERIATLLKVPIDSIGERSLKIVNKPSTINQTCAVFAQSDVSMLLRRGENVNDIIAGCCDAVVERVASLVRRVGVQAGFFISGGIAKNVGVLKRLEKKLDLKANISNEPQIVGALGAALLAQRELSMAELINLPY